jgi:3D-(3,5/4)-trihydroxycyclohexane-1,2-dione acylhydrolase (decyclizing)
MDCKESTMKTVRLTMSQALVHFLSHQMTEVDGKKVCYFAGVWGIFGHGNVAGLGEALYQVRDELPTLRGQNEQSMALAAVAFGKAMFRRRAMCATTSIGPGALNMVTAAAVAHVNRVPLLLLPGDVFANRSPDPVLQQIENFGDGTASANDCFKPVSRFFDRITRPEQLIHALERTMHVFFDPAECGPVTLSLCQDVQAQAFDYPESFFNERLWAMRRTRPSLDELQRAAEVLNQAKRPLIIAGGGVLYSQGSSALKGFIEKHGIPVCETQAGKSSLPHDHPLNMGAIGVTGTAAANDLARQADVILAIGTRLQDFTTGSWSLFENPDKTIIGLNTQVYDAGKHRSLPLVCDARVGLDELSNAVRDYTAPETWLSNAAAGLKHWQSVAAHETAPTNSTLPSDAQVVGAVQRHFGSSATLVGAAGGLPGELHKLWQQGAPGSYHMEYGFSCMGYEIAGGIGVKMAKPDEDVVVMLGDGSYMMMNSEIASSIMLGTKLTIIILDNRGYGCINRLQMATGGANFNNLLKDTWHKELPDIDFRAHAQSMGAIAVKVSSVSELETALVKLKPETRTCVVVIDTDPLITTKEGGSWWNVAVPEVSTRPAVNAARTTYEEALRINRLKD